MPSPEKTFRLSASDIEPLVAGMGSCFATDRITVEGYPVRFMYREEPDNNIDSGWRFMSGFEDDEYMNNPNNHAIYDVNTIANYDPTIIPLLEQPPGTAFEKAGKSEVFAKVADWAPPSD
jgi:hypothetical protein